MQIQTARSRLLAMVLECCCSCSRFAWWRCSLFVEKGSLALLHFQSEFHPIWIHPRVSPSDLAPPRVARHSLPDVHWCSRGGSRRPGAAASGGARRRSTTQTISSSVGECFSFGKNFCLICDGHSSPCAGSGRHQSCRSRRTCVRTDAIILLRPPFDAFSVE